MKFSELKPNALFHFPNRPDRIYRKVITKGADTEVLFYGQRREYLCLDEDGAIGWVSENDCEVIEYNPMIDSKD